MRLIEKPIRINSLELKNRLVMPPMASSKSDEDGIITNDLIDYYDKRSKGGHIGLIICEHSYVSQDGKASKGQASMASDQVVGKLKKLTKKIHDNSSPVFAQISHAGARASTDVTGEEVLRVSSCLLPKEGSSESRIMDQADIGRIRDDFIAGAVRAKEAGFDGVEIHSAHSYLLNQFLSPYSNQRSDKYGGSLYKRIRLHLEIIRGIRKKLGNFPLAIRLGAVEYLDGGLTQEDAIEAAMAFENAGVDLIDVSGGLTGYRSPNEKQEGYFSDVSKAIKDHVSIPVLVTGGIRTKEGAEKILEDKKADLIGIGRPILIDPNFPEKFMA